MKSQTQSSLLKWASLLARCSINSLIDIQNTELLVSLLNTIEPSAFEQLQHIDQRASNTMNSIIKCIRQYYKKQLRCNISQITQNLNIFKSPVLVWQLLIGVAIRGKNRDANINVILQMQSEQQSQLMILVQQVIEKLRQYDIDQDNSEISSSSHSSSIRNRKQSNFSRMNPQTTQYLNQLINQNQILKQKNIQLHNQVSQLKSLQQQLKKNCQQRINFFKSERYQFLDILTGNSSSIHSTSRNRKSSKFAFRQSITSNQSSKVFDDPLNGLNINITGSLADIANDLLNSIKSIKKQNFMLTQKNSLFQDHNKDLKLSFNRLIEQNKHLKQQNNKMLKLQKQYNSLKVQNEGLQNNETQLLKTISEIQQQKQFLRQMVEKLKQQKNQFLSKFNKKQPSMIISSSQKIQNSNPNNKGNNMLGQNINSTSNINVLKMPSMILRQMSGSQIQPESYNLNEQIGEIKNPAIKQKYQKQIEQLKEKINVLKQQNNQLKSVNKMLQKTIHKSMQKSEEIQKNIEEGYQCLFADNNSAISIISPKDTLKKSQIQQINSPVQIKLPNGCNTIWDSDNNKIIQNQNNVSNIQTPVINQNKYNQNKPEIIKQISENQENQDENNTNNDDNKILQFYNKMKKTVESYEQQQLLMIIQIESLKKQLNDVLMHKTIEQQTFLKEEQNKREQKKQKQNQIQKLQLKIKQLQTQNQKLEQTISSKNLKQHFHNNLIDVQKKQIQKNQAKQECSILIANQQVINEQGPNYRSQTKQQKQQSYVEQVPKQQSFVMFQINVSKPGGNFEENQQKDDQNHQSYKITKNNKDQGNREEKNKQNKIASEQYNQIQQGEQLNQNDMPIINYIRKSQHPVQSNSVQSIEQKILKPQNNQTIKSNQIQNDLLHLDSTNNRRPNMISGIGLRISQNQRRSFFAKSGFYNQSFIQISNKLQSELQADVQQISRNLKQRTNSHSFYNNSWNQQEHSKHQYDQKGETPKQQLNNSEQLVKKLQKIKGSYQKIQNFHIKNSQQIQTQLKQQLEIQKSQIVQLKIKNESLKQSLTLMISQKQHLNNQLKQIKQCIQKHNNSNEISQLMNRFSSMFNDICQLQTMMPELQKYLQGSKTKQLQILYCKQKIKRQKLQQEINVLMETIVYFRNMAISQDQNQLF